MASPFVTEITEDTFEAEVLNSDKLVLIDFYATWCGPCKAMAPTLEKFAEENQATVKVVKVDVDACPQLAAAFQIRSIPTLVTMKDGQGLIGAIGALPKSEMEKLVKDSLQLVAENNINNKAAPKGPKP